jgi:hypothetical protein
MTNLVPPTGLNPYNQKKAGFYGELGSGANARVKFLQTAMSYEELDKVTLIQDIPGSETWDVRDLFQRDVDQDRVSHQILPYLKDPTRLKYFNPLTLVLLPLTSQHGEVERELKALAPTVVEEEGHTYNRYAVDERFAFREHQQHPEFSSVEWNDRRVKVVAIDGQHRLSALKRWRNDPSGPGDLRNWRIPVILLGIVKDDPEKEAATVLEVVRKTFLYINTQAVQISRSRQILLDDESINSLCVQELVQASHANDVLPPENRNSATLPLLFFDWMGQTKHGIEFAAPAMVKRTVELEEWMSEYLLGDDGQTSQETRLELSDLIPPLDTRDLKRILSHEDSRRIRNQFREVLYPGLAFLLENFTPYRKYVSEVRALEADALKGSDIAKHAFSRLRFGTSQADAQLHQAVQGEFDRLVLDLEEIKNRLFDELVGRDVGMRAVVAAFATLKDFRDKRELGSLTWLEFAKWFVPGINKVYDQGWFETFQDNSFSAHLTHVVFDPSGSIVNYKMRDAGVSLGTMIALLVIQAEGDEDELADGWEKLADDLRVPLRRGYRKRIRANLRDTFNGTAMEFIAKVNKAADHDVDEHLEAFADYLGVDNG